MHSVRSVLASTTRQLTRLTVPAAAMGLTAMSPQPSYRILETKPSSVSELDLAKILQATFIETPGCKPLSLYQLTQNKTLSPATLREITTDDLYALTEPNLHPFLPHTSLDDILATIEESPYKTKILDTGTPVTETGATHFTQKWQLEDGLKIPTIASLYPHTIATLTTTYGLFPDFETRNKLFIDYAKKLESDR